MQDLSNYIQQQFEHPLTEVHLFFDQAVLQQFVHANKFMQLENPLILVVYDVLHGFPHKTEVPGHSMRKHVAMKERTCHLVILFSRM